MILAGFISSFMLAGAGTKTYQTCKKGTEQSADTTERQRKDVQEHSVIDEVVWVVGDEAILKSDIEMMRMQAAMEGHNWGGDPDCAIPEQIAVQKLFLNQAAIDSVDISDADVYQDVEAQINHWIQLTGSKEKLEEYRGQSITEMRKSMFDDFKNRKLVQRMRERLVADINVSPAEVRRFFKDLPEDSIPFVPTEVEVAIITNTPKIPIEEINRVKDELRDYTDRINSGSISFSTLARLYSEDPGTARLGGELDYTGRGLLDPAFAAVTFNLTDPNKISKIVESEFGYHIIQLVDRRGDKVKVRHILRKPKVSGEEIEKTMTRLDSIVNDVRTEKFTFEEAATYLSDDKDTRNSRGLMSNLTEMGRTSKFRMQDLPQEIAQMVGSMQVGEISKPFQMINSQGKTVCAVVKLKNRIEGHRATITDDFNILKDVVMNKRRNDFLHEWVKEKLKTTYVRISDSYKNCNFEYEGWIK